MINKNNSLKDLFDSKVDLYNQPSFIKNDPISIPHLFRKKQDIEIAGLFAALFAWGNRTTIINKSKELMERMDHAPHDFILNHTKKNLKKIISFKHRTFNDTDLLYFIEFLKIHYSKYPSLETAFSKWMGVMDNDIEKGLNGFYTYFFSLDYAPDRTRKHIACPEKKSSCKRLNMFLRWMVRSDDKQVDFGIWKTIKPSQLICPIDVHVARVAHRFLVLERKPIDWLAAKELTAYLRTLDPKDPVKYDFALFGMGAMEKY